MIVIQFWYIVSNVFVYLSGLNIILVLIPGYCQAAIIPTEDAYEYPEELTDLETFSPEITKPIPKDFFKGVDNIGAFEDISNGSDAETSTKSSDLCTESITKITTSLALLTNQTNGSSEAITKTSDLYTDSITQAASPTCSETSTKTTDLHTESITETETPPISITLCSNTSTDLYNESTTKETIPSSCSDPSTNTSDLYNESTTKETIPSSCSDPSTNASDLYTTELTTKLVTAELPNHINESATTIQSLYTASGLEPASNITNDSASAINFVSNSENSIVPPANISDLQDPSVSTNMVEESSELMNTATQPLVFNSLDHLEPKSSTRDALEQLYDEETTTFTPRYEEGYYDPKKAPTRYAQFEEYAQTTQWRFVSDYEIGIRDYNLILYAVNNSLVLEKGSLLNYVYFVFKEVLHVNMTLCDIRYCRYLRSKTHDNTKKVPPVLVAFTKMDVKNEILHKRKLLKPTGIKVEHDMPKKILDEQNALLKPLMDKYRAMGQYVVVRSGKLLVEGKVLTQINLPDKYTYDPLQTFVSYVTSTAKQTTPGVQLPRGIMDYGFGADKKFGKKKKGGRAAGGGKKKRKPMIRIPLDNEIGDELSVEVLFTTRKFW